MSQTFELLEQKIFFKHQELVERKADSSGKLRLS